MKFFFAGDLHDTTHWRESIVPNAATNSYIWHAIPMLDQHQYTGPFAVPSLILPDPEVAPIRLDARVRGPNMQVHVQKQVLTAIQQADVVFAWIPELLTVATAWQLGIASAYAKAVWIAAPFQVPQTYWLEQVAEQVAESARVAFQILLALQTETRFESRIEERFWKFWDHRLQLVPQYSIGPYRADFAHVPSKTIIELDGAAWHSSPEAIAHDTVREAYLRNQGWSVIRFTGAEVLHQIDTCMTLTIAHIQSRMPAEFGTG
jgi:very-short-patch-repair endonuclease